MWNPLVSAIVVFFRTVKQGGYHGRVAWGAHRWQEEGGGAWESGKMERREDGKVMDGGVDRNIGGKWWRGSFGRARNFAQEGPGRGSGHSMG